MKVCIVGAGAIGGLIGARLAAHTAADVSALARGETLEALNANGWRLRQGDKLVTGKARASSVARELGPQDLVVIAVKAPALATIAAQIGPLLKPDTIVLPAMNGVPWWFSQGLNVEGDPADPRDRLCRASQRSHRRARLRPASQWHGADHRGAGRLRLATPWARACVAGDSRLRRHLVARDPSRHLVQALG
jgi:ketopantoate reductase